MTDSRWAFYFVSAVIMSLGWGLRGTIGGGPMGAMIPGVMVGLCLCMMLGLRRNLWVIAAFAAVGVGFGGQMTYGQTIGFIREQQTFWWGFLGLTLKGAAWGFLGGACLALGLTARQFTRPKIAIVLACMVVGTFAGWAVIDHPKILYFSNRIDKPREELLIGMYLGTICLLAAICFWRERPVGNAAVAWEIDPARFAVELAVLGLLFGGIGFGGGGLFMGISQQVPPAQRDLPFWKFMEFTFGALFGLGLAIGCHRNRHALRADDAKSTEPWRDPLDRFPEWWQWTKGVLLVVGTLYILFECHGHFPQATPAQGLYTAVGALLLALAVRSPKLAPHVALSLTVTGFFRDFLLEAVKLRSEGAGIITPNAAWGVTWLFAMPICGWVMLESSIPGVRLARWTMIVTWVATLDCLGKFFVLFKYQRTLHGSIVPAIFVVELAVVTVALAWLSAAERRRELPA